MTAIEMIEVALGPGLVQVVPNDVTDAEAFGAIERDGAPPEDLALLAACLPPAALVWDTNPGRGAAMVLIARALGPQGRIIVSATGRDLEPLNGTRARAREADRIVLTDRAGGDAPINPFLILGAEDDPILARADAPALAVRLTRPGIPLAGRLWFRPAPVCGLWIETPVADLPRPGLALALTEAGVAALAAWLIRPGALAPQALRAGVDGAAILAAKPYATAFWPHWRRSDPAVDRAVAALAEPDPRKAAALRLAAMAEARAEDLAGLSTRLRLAADLGDRMAALRAGEALLARLNGGLVRPDRPFLAPASRFEGVDPGAAAADWWRAATLETLERQVAPSAFDRPDLSAQLLAEVETNPFRTADAERRLRLLRLLPSLGPAIAKRAADHVAEGRIDEALALGDFLRRFKPGDLHALDVLGACYLTRGRFREAAEALTQVVATSPQAVGPSTNLGIALLASGQSDAAVPILARAIALEPDYAPAPIALAAALQGGAPETACVALLTRALAINPDQREAWLNRGMMITNLGRPTEGMGDLAKAIVLAPDRPEAYINMANALSVQAETGPSVISYRRAVAVRPRDPLCHHGLCMGLQYGVETRPGVIAEAHAAFGACFPDRPRPMARVLGDRPLRVGFMSPDLRTHPVGYFLLPVIEALDQTRVTPVFYAGVARPDAVSDKLKSLGAWRDALPETDADLADRIRADGIDVLIDLAGHTSANRLATFALRPAPVQATWLGYPDTTGLRAIDARIVDGLTDPLDAPPSGPERLIRLDPCFLAYRGDPAAPEPAPPPCLSAGHVTFGSFNNLAKVSSETLDAWAAILRRLPGARLLIKSLALRDPATADRLIRRLEARGVARDRVETIGWIEARDGHFALYRRVDIALDTFPYNGTTTTCDALWMGVPVIALAGRRHVERVGVSLLTNAGFSDLIAPDVAAYVDRALALASDPRGLAMRRRVMRPFLAGSALGDVAAFTRRFERALRDLHLTIGEAAGVGGVAA